MTKSCRRAILLQYFGEDIEEDATCQSLGGAFCDNCQSRATSVTSSGEDDFKIIADATIDLPKHGVAKVRNGITIITNVLYIKNSNFLLIDKYVDSWLTKQIATPPQ